MRVVLIDDDLLVSVSLKTILEANDSVEVAAIGGSGAEAIELYEKEKPDVMLMDIRMEEMDGIEAGGKILEAYPDAKILYLTTFLDDEYIVKALNMGAKGYILKSEYDGIVPALEAVVRGQSVFGDSIRGKFTSLVGKKEEFDFEQAGISDKEKNIIELVAKGMSNKEIAGELFLSEGTVRNYISGLLEKLELRDRTQLAVFYYTKIKQGG
ncbi:MAG: response regulator transcription factor [Eubacterium sp.]|nr:response regulator transcription factor [Eubacterium sp.]